MDDHQWLILYYIAFLVVFLPIAFISGKARRKNKQIREAGIAYRDSLAYLKLFPGDASLREQTLRLGWAYVQTTREVGKPQVFDEMMLMSDLNATAGGTVAGAQRELPETSNEDKTKTVAERLQELQHLKDSGLITGDEFSAKRAAILVEL